MVMPVIGGRPFSQQWQYPPRGGPLGNGLHRAFLKSRNKDNSLLGVSIEISSGRWDIVILLFGEQNTQNQVVETGHGIDNICHYSPIGAVVWHCFSAQLEQFNQLLPAMLNPFGYPAYLILAA
jgi:hypothetical protein